MTTKERIFRKSWFLGFWNILMLFVRKYFNRQRNDSRKLEFPILIFDICCSIINNLPIILNVKTASQFVWSVSTTQDLAGDHTEQVRRYIQA